MKYSGRFAVVLFAALVLVALASAFYITPTTISDSDFSTYTIVPIMMLPLFALFMLKEGIEPDVRRKDVIIGAAMFVALIAITLLAREEMSYLFLGMRIDMLFFPLLIVALVVCLFGTGNINRFRWLVLYALFASPVVLLWLGGTNTDFVVANTIVVFGVVSHVFSGAVYLPPMTVIANGYRVGIGETCIGIGILIATIMFLAPMAYLFDGKRRRKVFWTASGLLLILALNAGRMLGISLAWFAYGPSATILTIHVFAGMLLFYATIVAMILVAKRYGLTFPAGNVSGKAKKARTGTAFVQGIVVAVVISIAYCLFTLNYAGASPLSPVVLYHEAPFNASLMAPLANAMSNHTGFHSEILTDTQNNRIVLSMSNATFNSTYPIEMLIVNSSSGETAGLTSKNAFLGELNFLSGNGNVDSVYYLGSGGQGYLVYSARVPYVYPNQSYTEADIYAVLPAQLVNGREATCLSTYDYAYSGLMNVMNVHAYNASANQRINSAYCMLRRVVGT